MKSIVIATMGVALCAGTALAADLPSRVAPPVFVAPVAVPYSWTGFESRPALGLRVRQQQ